MIVEKTEISNIPMSQSKFELQKIIGCTPVISWTCLALVMRSKNGKTKNTATNKLKPKVNDIAKLYEVGLINELFITSSNFTPLPYGKGWFAIVIDWSVPL